MQILVISQYFWPESFRLNDMMIGLKEKGHEITVLTGVPNHPQGHFHKGYKLFNFRPQFHNGIKIYRVPIVPRKDGSSFNLVINYLSYTISSTLFGPLFLRKQKFDVVLFVYSPVPEGIPAMLIGKFKKIPIVYWVQDIWPDSLLTSNSIKSKKALGLVGKVIDFIYSKCSVIMVQSEAFIPMIQKTGFKRDIIFLPNGAEDLYKPIPKTDNKEILSKIPNGFIIMFAGSIGESQDFETILSTAKILENNSDIYIVVVGDGRKFEWVKNQIQNRNLKNVKLLGHHPMKMMPEFFSVADVMLVSLKDTYIYGLTIPGKTQSYLACGKPILASLNGEGARIIEESDAGKTCPAENPEKLAEAIIEMYQMDKKTLVQKGLNGRKYFENHFKRKVLIDRLEKTLKEA